MKKYKVKKGLPNLLSINEEIEVTKYIAEIVKEDNIKVIAYNICRLFEYVKENRTKHNLPHNEELSLIIEKMVIPHEQVSA